MTLPALPGDFERAAGLRRMKLVALGLLLTAAVVFVIARANHDNGAAWGYVQAFAEAAMIGALADWFAVTALFRHPLGIPIPHTAIIPTRKDSLGRSLGEFVETNFMAKDVLDERLAHAQVGQRLGEWLTDSANAKRASIAVADVVRGAVEIIDDTQVQDAIERIVDSRIRSTRVAPLLGKAIDIGIEGDHHRRLLDAVFTGLQTFLRDNRATFRTRLEQESPWWMPESIDNRIFTKIYDGVGRFLADMRNDPTNEVRVSIEQHVADFARRLGEDPALIAKGEELKEEMLTHPEVQAWIRSLWKEGKASLIGATSKPDSELHRRIAESLQQLGERLRSEPDLRAKVDQWVARALGYVVDNYRSEVSALIESTIERWDGESTSRKIELQVGRDLQFIRINGTIVGGLAGLAIYSLGQLFFS